MKKMILIGMALLSFILLVGCSIETDEEQQRDKAYEDFLIRENWIDEHKFMTHQTGTPQEHNCSTLAWIIENSVYPNFICSYYNSTTPDSDIPIGVSSSCYRGTKDVYDDYFLKNCLTKMFTHKNPEVKE